MMSNLVWFDDQQGDLIHYTGGKGASLSRMYKSRLPVPNGFVLTAPLFLQYARQHKLFDEIQGKLATINFGDCQALENTSAAIRNMIVETPLPLELTREIAAYYAALGGETLAVAVRSSSTAEDLAEASFAGQQETFLYVVGKDDLLEKIKRCWASLYNGRAIFYRKQKGFAEKEVSIAVVVQKMVNADKSGVMFTTNPITKNRDHVLIEGAWGLGEGIVSGEVTPDNYIVDKCSGHTLEEYISEKEKMIVRDISSKGVEEQEVPADKRWAKVLTYGELKQLTRLASKLEAFFGKPQDVEWAIEGDELFLLQSRPITTL